MIPLDSTTAFRLVRRLAVGQGTFAMYLLVCPEEVSGAIEEDLRAEAEVQLGSPIPILDIAEVLLHPESNLPFGECSVGGLHIRSLSAEVISLLDTHVVRLERGGRQLLFLAAPEIAEQLLIEAPNFRNRLTEVMCIIPDPSIGRGTA
jgi:hypothetical protein